MIERQMLPKYIQKIVYDYLKNLSVDIPIESLLLSFIVKASRSVCFNRVKIKGPIRDMFPNIYAINFLPSGCGKDAPINDLNRACRKYNNLIKEQRDSIYNKQKKEVEDFIKLHKLKSAAARDYRINNAPRMISIDGNPGTPEGLRSQREAMQIAKFGSSHFAHSEFVDFLKRQTNETREIMELIKDAYEGGNMKGKIIKTENISKGTYNIPQTMLVHSDLTGLTTCDKTKKIVKEVLGGGFARRAIFCFPSILNIIFPSYEEEKDNIKHANGLINYIDNLFLKVHNLTMLRSDMSGYELDYKSIHLSDEVKKAYYQHRKKVNDENNKKDKEKDGLLVSELKDRPHRSLRLAAIVAIFRIADSFDDKHIDSIDIKKIRNTKVEITMEDYAFAADYLIDYIYGEHFMRFYDDTRYSVDISDLEKMDKILMKHDEISKTKFRKELNITWKDTNGLNNMLKSLQEYYNENGKKLIIRNGRGLAEYYSIESDSREQNPEEEIMCKLSIGDSNDNNCTKFKTIEVPFEKLHKITSGKVRYSAGIFKGKRKQDNWIGGDTLMMFDVDNDKENLTLKQVEKIFNGYKYLAVTTKRHMSKDKGRKQRFRLIFPVDPIVGLDKEEYKLMKKSFLDFFKISKYFDLCADLDCSRIWHPHNGKKSYSKGTKLINWKMFKKDKHKKTKKKYKYTGSDTRKENARPDQMFVLPNKDEVGWDHFEGITKSSPVFCTDHEDKSPSAFVAINSNSGNKFFKCTVCDTLYFQQ